MTARRAAHVLQGVAFAAGLAGFVALVTHAGVAPLWHGVRDLGAGLVLFVALAGLEHVLHASGWQRCFLPEHTPPLRPLAEAYLAGYAFGVLTPTATVGGDVLRASLLPRDVPAAEAAASVTADRLACSLGDAAIGLAGVGILLGRAPLESWQEAGLVGATLLFGAGIGGFLWVQRSGRTAARVSRHPFLERLAGERFSARVARAAEDLDARLHGLHVGRPEAFRGALLRNLLATGVGGVQVAVFLAWLGVPDVAHAAATIFLVGISLDLFSFFVPGRLGVQEASRMLGASVAGLEPTLGLLLSLVLRLDQLVWVSIGLVLHARLAARRRAPA